VLTSPITKLWDLAKRRTDDASSTRTR
jgi:hypothetical protein